ncbi:MAG: sigma-54-dependent transcriptional regulator, partial [Janthinobacterium lividum]
MKSRNTLENLSLLIVDDDLPVLTACGKIAAGVGFDVYTAASASEARTQVINHSPDVVLMDLKMPAGGLSLLEEIRDKRPRSSIVVMTAFATVTSAVEAMRIGATDYLTKPFAMDELTRVLERAGERRSYELESKRIQGYLKGQRDSALIGTSPEIEKLHRIVQKVAPASHPVLILGEEGTGKEAVARAIHAGGAHATRPFSVLECGQLAPTVLEGELFGYVRSPNTGESRVKEGL